MFALESLKYNYNELKDIDINSNSTARRKLIQLPKNIKL